MAFGKCRENFTRRKFGNKQKIQVNGEFLKRGASPGAQEAPRIEQGGGVIIDRGVNIDLLILVTSLPPTGNVCAVISFFRQ